MTEATEQHRALAAELVRLIEWVGALESRLDRQRLAAARVRPGQLPDSLLQETDIKFIKGSEMKMFGRVRTVEPAGAGVIISAAIDVGRDAVAKLREAFGRVIDAPLSEMHQRGVSGRVLRADVGEDGRVVVKALVTARVAGEKIRERVYHGLSLDCDIADGEITEISLVDRPFEQAAGGSDRLICKVFDRRETEVTSLERVLRKFTGPGTGGRVQLNADERATLLAVPEISARLEALSHIELGIGDLRQRQQAEANALVVIKAAQQQTLTGPRFTVR
jgi:hypothetical protein